MTVRLADGRRSARLMSMIWEEVCADPSLQDLPYKMELDRWGNIEMSPAKSYHFEFQGEIAHLLRTLCPDGVVMPECAIETSDSTKVADVAWVSRERRRRIRHDVSYGSAPEICVEILSMSSGPEEMRHKRRLYLEAGAEEFWLCDEHGQMSFFSAGRPLLRSALCPGFPDRIEIPD